MNDLKFSGNSVVSVPDDSEIKIYENAERPVKRIAAIHDLSCFGRCALTVVIPALSALGYQVVPVPTALLSTHTGGFSGMYFEDLTGAMSDIHRHFSELELKFDAIYTGFLGSEAQIAVVEAFISRFGKDCTVIVDPVMGDDGMLYSTYNNALVLGMSRLCKHADIITPNVTEACFITGIEHKNTASMSERERLEYLESLANALEKTGKKKIAITGIFDGEDFLGTYGRDGEKCFYHRVCRVSRNYPGTGDLFASVLLGEILRGASFENAIAFASDYTSRVMEYTARFDTPARDGVALEALLFELTERVKKD